MIAPMLHDPFSRKFSYLRLSVTEACNFRCRYCLPDGFVKKGPEELNTAEIGHLLNGLARAGFTKLRLTGGEPTTRRDLPEILERAVRTGVFRQIALSTNGWNLKRLAGTLFSGGLTHVNVSVDSLDPVRFRELTGRGELDTVLEGIEECLRLGFERVKLNAVLHADTAGEELELFLKYARSRPVSVRFIELMRTSARPGYRDRHFLSAGTLRLELLKRGFTQRARGSIDGPAVEYAHPGYEGTIGLISPHSEGFCESCNRLRITSRGALRLCLFGEDEFSLRPYLQDEAGAGSIPEILQKLLVQKPATHLLASGRSGLIQSFSQVGG
jgi:cyclic pyranopterin phosphate synthase